MNPIASQTTPQVMRDGGNGGVQKASTPVSSASVPSQTAQGPVLMPMAIAQSNAASDSAKATRHRVATAVETRRTALLRNQDPVETYEITPETGARPAAPLRSFAQIPTQMIQEINRMREDFAAIKARGIEGRSDPTPMPARPEAIGTPAAT